ncbi:MAG: 4Fe-4S binding protein [Pseudomonadota bacterium]
MGYFTGIAKAATTIVEGLTITASHLLRRPITVQYPDRTMKPVKEMLPPVYRGFLDVDLGACTACTLCQQACPIQCIKVEIMKSPSQRLISRFDIDIGLCMFCGLCTEACPTSAVHFSREFERATPDLKELVFRFVKGAPVVPYRPSAKKAEGNS